VKSAEICNSSFIYLKFLVMTETQIGLVKRTWKIFRGIDPGLVGDTFYSKLFNDNPSLRRMFPKSMEQQYRKLIDMLSTIVARLEKMEELKDDIAAMAQRHTGYGVRPGHYKLVGKALLWTLKQGLGNDWTKDVEEAWTTCYNVLSTAMINAAGYEQKKVS
jgi:hemoglobin-like flavoprotein